MLEDDRGVQLIGESGQLLRRVCANLGVDLDEDCWKTNACCCRPPGNVTPTSRQIEACRPQVFSAIERLRPKTVVLLGASAVESVVGAEYQEDRNYSSSRWRGWRIPSPVCNAMLCPTYHPSFVLRMARKCEYKRERNVSEVLFQRDLELAFAEPRRPPGAVDWRKRVALASASEAVCALEGLSEYDGLVAFDYETTGLKPHRAGHRIVCCSLSWKPRSAIAFMLDAKVKPALRRFLKGAARKVAANLQFEDEWSRVALGVEVRNWHHDTMLAAHVLDNRKGAVCGLKFQAYVNFGEGGYTEGVGALKGKRKGSPNDFNNIGSIPEDELLLYCGMDSMFEWMLAARQLRQLGASL